MAETKHPILASDGWPFFFGGLLVLLFALKYQQWWLVFLCGLYFATAFLLFRDPHREVPSIPLAVVSPVDGVVEIVECLQEGLLKRESLYLKIKLSKSGAYTTRSPTEGKIMSLNDAESGSRLVESHGLWVRTDENDDVVMLLRGSGYKSLYPAVADIRYGERVGQGDRIGLNRLADYVELYLPAGVKLLVGLNDKVYAASSVLAEYQHQTIETDATE